MKLRNKTIETYSGPSRRGFLGYLGIGPSLTGLSGAGLLAALQTPGAFASTGPLDAAQRRHRAFVIRRDAAIFQRDRPDDPSTANSDEQLYPNRIASFAKGLPHNDLGEVDLNAYNALIRALNSGLASDFEAIPLGGTVKLANPQAAFCFNMEGWARPARRAIAGGAPFPAGVAQQPGRDRDLVIAHPAACEPVASGDRLAARREEGDDKDETRCC